MLRLGLYPKGNNLRRRAVAAVEFAVCSPFLVLLVFGIIEVARMIQVQHILVNSAREGARLAAQGQILNSEGAFTLIHVNSGNPSIKNMIQTVLQRANIPTTNVKINFRYISGDVSLTEPHQGAKGQLFEVTVEIPFADVNFLNFRMFSGQTLTGTANMASLVNDPFQVNTTLPTN